MKKQKYKKIICIFESILADLHLSKKQMHYFSECVQNHKQKPEKDGTDAFLVPISKFKYISLGFQIATVFLFQE